jgi:hypothetical protein
MAAHVSIAEVQQWLEVTKARVTQLDLELEGTATELVLSQLRSTYAVEAWVDEGTTPKLVRSVISLLYAGWFYDRTYSEDTPDSATSYGSKLESAAMALLGSLVAGSTLLDETTVPRDNTSFPVFWPTDAATLIASQEGDDAEGAAPRAFTMGKVF